MVEDNPEDLVHDLAADAVFGGHPLGRPVIGSADVIGSLSTRAIRAYHRSAYVGGNVVVAAAGNVRHERLVELVAARRSGPSGRRTLRRALLRRPPGPSVRFLRRPTEQYHVVLSGPGVARDDPRRYAGWVLDTLLGGSSSSRLFQEIRERRGMAYSVYSFASHFQETGHVGISLGTREENLVECMRVVRDELASVAAGRLRLGELVRAQESIEGRLLLAQESTSSRMTRLGRALVTDTELVRLRETVRRIRAVTEEDVVGLARELFDPARLSAAGIGPSEKRFTAALAHLAPVAEAA
jgi:predicted Zn-dependent peptidase